MGEEGEPRPEEADGVDEDDEDDDQIVIEKLGRLGEGDNLILLVLRSQPAGKCPDIRDDVVTGTSLAVHDHSDQAHKQGGALGDGQVDDKGLGGTGGLDLFE